jgi:hypothetical protein
LRVTRAVPEIVDLTSQNSSLEADEVIIKKVSKPKNVDAAEVVDVPVVKKRKKKIQIDISTESNEPEASGCANAVQVPKKKPKKTVSEVLIDPISSKPNPKPKKARKKEKEPFKSSVLPAQEAQSVIAHKMEAILNPLHPPREVIARYEPVIRVFGETERKSTASLWEAAGEIEDLSQPRFLDKFVPKVIKSAVTNDRNLDFVTVQPADDETDTESDEASGNGSSPTASSRDLSAELVNNGEFEDSMSVQILIEEDDAVHDIQLSSPDALRYTKEENPFKSQRVGYKPTSDTRSTQTEHRARTLNMAVQTDKIKDNNFSNGSTPYMEIEYLKQQHSADIKMYMDAHAEEVSALKAQLTLYTADPTDTINARVAEAECKFKRGVMAMRDEWEIERASLEDSHRKAIAVLEQRHVASLKDIEAEHRLQLDELRKLHALSSSAQQKDMECKFAEQISTLKTAHLDDCKQMLEKNNAIFIEKEVKLQESNINELNFVKQNYQDQLKELNSTIETQKETLDIHNVLLA